MRIFSFLAATAAVAAMTAFSSPAAAGDQDSGRQFRYGHGGVYGQHASSHGHGRAHGQRHGQVHGRRHGQAQGQSHARGRRSTRFRHRVFYTLPLRHHGRSFASRGRHTFRGGHIGRTRGHDAHRGRGRQGGNRSVRPNRGRHHRR